MRAQTKSTFFTICFITLQVLSVAARLIFPGRSRKVAHPKIRLHLLEKAHPRTYSDLPGLCFKEDLQRVNMHFYSFISSSGQCQSGISLFRSATLS